MFIVNEHMSNEGISTFLYQIFWDFPFYLPSAATSGMYLSKY